MIDSVDYANLKSESTCGAAFYAARWRALLVPLRCLPVRSIAGASVPPPLRQCRDTRDRRGKFDPTAGSTRAAIRSRSSPLTQDDCAIRHARRGYGAANEGRRRAISQQALASYERDRQTQGRATTAAPDALHRTSISQ